MTNKSRNYYDILEIPVNSNSKEIHEGYIRAKNAYSGDSVVLYSLLSKEECQEALDQIELAYSVLSSPDKRREYDRVRGIDVKTPETHPGKIQQYAPSQEQEFKINVSDIEVSRLSAQKRFHLNFKSDREYEEIINNCTQFSGKLLKEIREYKNVTVERMSDLSKISKTYITNIEDEDLSSLPAIAYIRGFVYQYAKILKLEPNLVANSYIEQLTTDGAQS